MTEQSRPNEARPPSHILRIEVPLDLAANAAAESYDIDGALAQAWQAILPMIRVGTLGLLCGDLTVTLNEVEP